MKTISIVCLVVGAALGWTIGDYGVNRYAVDQSSQADNPEVAKPAEVAFDITNDPGIAVHYGDYVRFKYGFYKGIEGKVIDGREGMVSVKATQDMSDSEDPFGTIRRVKPETLEVIPQPTPAPDLFDVPIR